MEEESMSRKTFAFAAAACAALVLGCATEPEKPKPAAAAPAPAPVPRAAEVKPAPAPKKPAVVNLSSTGLFEFNKATLTAEARARLDSEVIGKMQDFGEIRYVNINGHADRLGSVQYNQKLSERRAEAVRAYLVSKGGDPAKMETFGFGKTMPVKSCPDEAKRAALIECLSPNRRVVVEIQGSPR
jgi:OOP family OmpA-OmpF porin